MAKGSTYMRGLCIVLNVLLGIFGVILLLFVIVAKSVKVVTVEDGSKTLLLSVGFGVATILLALLGTYGAYREQVLALLLYSIFMTIELILLMVLAIIATLAQPQIERTVEESFSKMNTLSKDDVFQRELHKLQREAECCGLTDYSDWNGHYPHSCLCSSDLYKDSKCISAKMSFNNTKLSKHDDSESATLSNSNVFVFKKSCGPVIMEYVKNAMRILVGILFTLATIMVAAVAVAVLLLYRIHTRTASTGLSQNNDSRMKYELQPDKTL